MSFPAKYAGQCSCCGKKFDIGDEITYLDEQIVIQGHIPEPDLSLISDREDICNSCFLVKPKGQKCVSCDGL